MDKNRFFASTTAVCLRTALSTDMLCRESACDAAHVLGSFWPNSSQNYESRLIKCFKECLPVRAFEPNASEMARFYAALVLGATGGERFTWVARALSSSETKPEDSRPMSLLVDLICTRTGARDLTGAFYKVSSRPPMRGVKRLAGPEALAHRLRYVTQDLFIRRCNMGGTALLLDDIQNTGASMRVYAAALKQFAGIERVVAVNLAATRFSGGRDGLGMLKLDTSSLMEHKSLGPVWADADGRFHMDRECPDAHPPLACEVRFMAERKMQGCGRCAAGKR